jgi:cytochrome b561
MSTVFEKSHSATLRFWHWLNAFVVTLLLMTVILRKTFLSSRKMTTILSEKLGKAVSGLTPETLKAATGAIRDQMWDWHYRLGFVLAGLFLFRVIFVKKPLFMIKDGWRAGTHAGLIKTTYAAFYAATAFMAASGLFMYFSGDLHVSEALVDEVQEIHEWFQWFFFGFGFLHLAGVIRAELTGESGIVSRMISKGK